MTAPLCFLDTETTSLRPDRRAWEIGLYVRRDGAATTEHHYFVDSVDLDLGNADQYSLKVGRFYDRHPHMAEGGRKRLATTVPEAVALKAVERLTRGAYLIGSVPDFDAHVLGTRMRVHGVQPSWHHHLQDVGTLAVGFLLGQGKPIGCPRRGSDDELGARFGLQPMRDEDRHTALGDARWVMDLWDAVMLGVPTGNLLDQTGGLGRERLGGVAQAGDGGRSATHPRAEGVARPSVQATTGAIPGRVAGGGAGSAGRAGQVSGGRLPLNSGVLDG